MVERRDDAGGVPAVASAGVSRTPLIAAAVGMVCAIAAFVAGATEIAFMTFALSLTATVVERTVAFDQARAARRRQAAEERDHRETVEKLADRMWELSESEERFRGLVDALGDIVVHRDQDGRIVFANRALADVAGIAAPKVAGKRLEDLGFALESTRDDEPDLDGRDIRHLGPRGDRWFSWVELSTRDDATGQVQRRAIGRDITERKASESALIAAREKAESGSAAKSRFLATVSHEIRTPLNGIMGMAKLLADTGLSEEQRTYATAITSSGTALLELIDDLLDFSRIEAGRIDLAPEPVSPRDVAEAVGELLSARAFSKGIGLGVYVAPDVPALVTCDPGKLRQILVNPVGNAVKFTEAGGVAITVTRDGDGDTPSLRFSVRDTGPGIAEADVARIFEDFEQGDGSTTRTHGGTGLGLAISRRIADTLGGAIEVSSRKGAGSTFDFVLPVVAPVAEPHRTAIAGLRVVVALPEAIEAETVARAIEAHGGVAAIASTAEEASRLVADSASCDVLLAGAAFEDELPRLVSGCGTAQLRVLALLSPGERGRLDAMRRQGCEGYLVRPVRRASLLRMLEQRPDRTGPVEREPGKPIGRKSGSGLRILVAEDNPVNALLVRVALGKAGHDVTVVGDGRAAVDAAAARRFDVVLMDLHMPEMDGLDALDRIRLREESEGSARTPVLVLTADGQEETRRLAIAHGANGVVVKPLDPLALIATVEEQAAA